MRALALSAISLALVALPARADEPKKEESIPCTLDKLDKEWGLKFKSLASKDGFFMKTPVKELIFTVEFTKDVTDVKAVRAAFQAGFAFETKPAKDRPLHVVFYFFDEDNVAIFKFPVSYPDGEITGKMGDAFRVVVRVSPVSFPKVKKIELRMSEKE